MSTAVQLGLDVLNLENLSVRTLCASRDGERIAVLGDENHKSKIRLFNTSSTLNNAVTPDFPEGKATTSIALSADGKWIAIGNESGEICMQEFQDVGVKKIQERKLEGAIAQAIHLWSENTDIFLSSGTRDGKVTLRKYSHDDWTIVGNYDHDKVEVVSFDGRWIVSAGRDDTDYTLKVARMTDSMDGSTGQLKLMKIFNISGRVRTISLLGSKNIIASGGWDAKVVVRDLESWADLHVFATSSGVESICFSEDGSLIAIGGWDKLVVVRDLITGALIYTFDNTSTVFCVAFFCRSGKLGIISCGEPGEDNLLKIRDLSKSAAVHVLEHSGDVRAISMSGKETHSLVASGSDKGSDKTDGHVCVQNLTTGQILAGGPATVESSVNAGVLAVCLSDSLLVSGGRDLTVKVSNLKVDTNNVEGLAAVKHEVREDYKYNAGVRAICVAGNMIASGGTDGTIMIDTRRCLSGACSPPLASTFGVGHTSTLQGAQHVELQPCQLNSGPGHVPDGQRDDKRRDTSSIVDQPGAPLAHTCCPFGNSSQVDGGLTRHEVGSPIYTLCFIKASRIAIGTHDGWVRIMNLHPWKEDISYKHNHSVFALDVLQSEGDGKCSYIASGGDDNLVVVRDLVTLRGIHRFKHSSSVKAISMCKGPLIASGGMDMRVVVRHVDSGCMLYILEHMGFVFAAKLSEDGRYLASGGSDKRMHVYSLQQLHAGLLGVDVFTLFLAARLTHCDASDPNFLDELLSLFDVYAGFIPSLCLPRVFIPSVKMNLLGWIIHYSDSIARASVSAALVKKLLSICPAAALRPIYSCLNDRRPTRSDADSMDWHSAHRDKISPEDDVFVAYSLSAFQIAIEGKNSTSAVLLSELFDGVARFLLPCKASEVCKHSRFSTPALLWCEQDLEVVSYALGQAIHHGFAPTVVHFLSQFNSTRFPEFPGHVVELEKHLGVDKQEAICTSAARIFMCMSDKYDAPSQPLKAKGVEEAQRSGCHSVELESVLSAISTGTERSHRQSDHLTHVSPLPSLSKYETFKALVTGADTSVFGLPIVRSLVSALWTQVKWRFYLYTSAFFVMLVLASVFGIIGLTDDFSPSDYYKAEDRRLSSSFGCFVVAQALNCILSYREVLVLRSDPWQYFSDSWNYFQIISHSLLAVTFILVLVGVDGQSLSIVSTITMFLLWFPNSLFFLKLFPETSFLLEMLISTVRGVSPFVCVVVVIVIGMSIGFQILASGAEHVSFVASVWTTYKMAVFYGGDPDSFSMNQNTSDYSGVGHGERSHDTIFGAQVVLLSVGFSLLYMVGWNPLIAVINKVYDSFYEDRTSQWYAHISKIILDEMKIMSRQGRKDLERRTKWILIHSPSPDGVVLRQGLQVWNEGRLVYDGRLVSASREAAEMQERVGEIERGVKGLEKLMESRLASMQDLLLSLEHSMHGSLAADCHNDLDRIPSHQPA